MSSQYFKSTVLAASLAAIAGSAFAAAPADWSKVPGRTVTVFYPGTSPMEWINKGTEHSGARGLREGDSCSACHEKELADMGNKMVTGQKLEPHVIKGKAGSIPVNVQAAHDGANLYLRFSWKQPAGGGEKMDADNPVKLAFMLANDGLMIKSGKKEIDIASRGGCWGTCHEDSRTMPDAKDDKKTKYVEGGNVAGGRFLDLLQWQSKSNKGTDGHVADKREMTGGTALISASGEKKGDTWVVTFSRKFAGGTGDVALAAGKTVNFGMAIHDDFTRGRFHHVSMGYSLGIDAKADITAVKQ
ncbi:MAG: hypothetical protein IPJ52_04370 [Rhodocyclaceae bacterium]|nr:hypothetical protein [Rhodocyclaceae bacterium]MBK7813593.1 hypothetical protein [Rhodocyclaceae bacterium]